MGDAHAFTMNFSLIFENTNDSIVFNAINPDVVEYYVQQLNHNSINLFSCSNSNNGDYIKNRLTTLHESIEYNNVLLEELFDQKFPTYDLDQYLDQRHLNQLHVDWVKAQTWTYNVDEKRQQFNNTGLAEQLYQMYPENNKFPTLNGVLLNIGKQKEFDLINDPNIHELEQSFNRIRFSAEVDWIEFKNPFPKSYATNDVCNFYFPFCHLGRSLYNKFVNYDHNLEFDDENTFDELLKFVEISLSRPQTIPYSNEFIEWCHRHNREPAGILIPMGNIPDLSTNLKSYRTIMLNNLLQKNKFTIKIH